MRALPSIFAAALVLVLAYIVGRLVARLVENILSGAGFNTVPARLGLGATANNMGDRTPSQLVSEFLLKQVKSISEELSEEDLK